MRDKSPRSAAEFRPRSERREIAPRLAGRNFFAAMKCFISPGKPLGGVTRRRGSTPDVLRECCHPLAIEPDHTRSDPSSASSTFALFANWLGGHDAAQLYGVLHDDGIVAYSLDKKRPDTHVLVLYSLERSIWRRSRELTRKSCSSFPWRNGHLSEDYLATSFTRRTRRRLNTRRIFYLLSITRTSQSTER